MERPETIAKNWRELIRPRELETDTSGGESYGKFACEPLERVPRYLRSKCSAGSNGRQRARDTIAVDLGTATTFDCITADGVFAGGVISPGVNTGAETLVRRTARLPRIEL